MGGALLCLLRVSFSSCVGNEKINKKNIYICIYCCNGGATEFDTKVDEGKERLNSIFAININNERQGTAGDEMGGGKKEKEKKRLFG